MEQRENKKRNKGKRRLNALIIAWIAVLIGLWVYIVTESVTAGIEIQRLDKQTEAFEQHQQEIEKHREESGQNEQLRRAMRWKSQQCKEEKGE